jgi:CxxC motif-containing protein (DUF1111 family)
VRVPAFTDLKLHDITSGPNDPNREPLDMHQAGGTPAFFAGNSRFVTKKLWGCANEPPYFHHGRFTTLREAIEAHAGEAAVLEGELKFVSAGCADCHTPYLPLTQNGWIYSEPNPFNPAGNLRLSDDYVATYGALRVDLNSKALPGPRLRPQGGVVRVPAFTDLKLHDITSGPNDPNREPLDMHEAGGTPAFFAGNSRFVTKKLWGCANEPPYFHHGRFTTLREAIEAHAGEADASRAAWDALSDYQRDCIVEFLKTLQVLRPDAHALIVDEHGQAKNWPPFPWTPPAQ